VIIISDTNILSSMAAGEAFPALLRLFARAKIAIPLGVQEELREGLDRGRAYLEPIIQAIRSGRIEAIPLSAEEELLTFNYPTRLGDGERQAIALAQTRKATLLSNDDRAIRYCQQKRISHLDLVDILRLLWARQVMSQDEVRVLIEKMEQVERLNLAPAERSAVFAPRGRK
jgi:predicted nucleic acid-binding protein